MHKFTDTTSRSIIWLKRANDEGRLEMKAPYQRNPVWSEKQQGALVETILLEYPIPEIYMQDIVSDQGDEKHIVVDGQQRIRAVLDFIAGLVEILEEDSKWYGLTFEDLSPEDKQKIYSYKFVTRILPSMPDDQIRGIFQRINRNTVTLNAQELRHATYWGKFIKLMEEIADFDQWSKFGIFSANDRRRMVDAEFVSEIAVAYLNGLQNKKIKLEDYYQLYEQNFDSADEVRSLFSRVIGEIEQTLPELSKTRWKKKSDFYTLFLCLSKMADQFPLPSEKRSALSSTLIGFANAVDSTTRDGSEGKEEHIVSYTNNVERAASDLGSRRSRENALMPVIKKAIGLLTPEVIAS